MPMAAPSRAACSVGSTSARGATTRPRRSSRPNEAYFRERLPDHDDDLLGHARFHLGVIAWVQGDEARARSLLRDAVERYDRSGTPADAIDPLRYLGLIACAAGDLDEAAMWFREELTRLRQRGSRAAIAVGLADVATLAAAREAWQPAVRLFAKAEALLQAEAAAFSLPARDHYERAHARAREALGDCRPGGGCRRPGAHPGAGSGGGRGGAGAGPR